LVSRYNDVSLNALIPNKRPTEFPSRTVIPIPSPIPSPKPSQSGLPHMPHLQHRMQQSSESLVQSSGDERSAPRSNPTLLSSAPAAAIPRPSAAAKRSEASRASKYSTREKPRNSTWTQKSVYSTGEGWDSDQDDRFEFDYEDREDEEMSQGRGFDVIAAMLNGEPIPTTSNPPSPPRAASRQSTRTPPPRTASRQSTHNPPPRAASRQSRTSPSPPPISQHVPDLSGRQKRVSNRPVPSTLGIPSGPRSNTSPLASPRRRAAPGGAQWI